MIQNNRKGQSTLEFLLYISVIVVALVALSWIAFGVSFKDGYDTMKEDVEIVFSNAQQEGSGNLR